MTADPVDVDKAVLDVVGDIQVGRISTDGRGPGVSSVRRLGRRRAASRTLVNMSNTLWTQ